jgi:hypothetical protein
MRFTRKSRLVASGIVAASFSLILGVTQASAAVLRPAAGCDVSFPDWNETTLVEGPSLYTTYDLHLSNGTLEAYWANNYTTLSIAYVKTGGSEITADFQEYGYHDNGECYYADDDGAFTESAGQTRSFAWNNADLGDFVYATMYVKGQGYFAVEFTYNNAGGG